MADLKRWHLQTLGVDWRWAYAQRPSSHDKNWIQRRHTDHSLNRAIVFIENWRSEGRAAAERREPLVAAAEALERDVPLRNKVQILILAALTDTEIAERLLVDSAVVQLYADLFFDVRPVLRGTSWIYHRVIAPVEKLDTALARKLQLAFSGGPSAGRTILDLEDAEARGAEELLPYTAGERLIQRIVKAELKFDRFLGANRSSSAEEMRFLVAYGRYQNERARIDLARQALGERCEAAARKYNIDKLRLESEIERDKRRVAEAAAESARCAVESERRSDRKQPVPYGNARPIVPRIHDTFDDAAARGA